MFQNKKPVIAIEVRWIREGTFSKKLILNFDHWIQGYYIEFLMSF